MRKLSSLLVLSAFLLAGCQLFNSSPPTPTPVPATPTPSPPIELTICLGYEPESLYPYNAVSLAAQDVMQAIYDGPIDIVDGQPMPVILEKLPNFSDGSARFTPVGVNPGDPVVNTAGYLVSLQTGVQVFPTGCTSPACAITYDGISPLQMDQMTAIYKLKPGLTWSDGLPLTAGDSVFSFNIAADPATPINKHNIDQTATYTAMDDMTVEWSGMPGLVTDAFERYFWIPLPKHAWSMVSADDLLTSEEANRAPLSWGPYMVSEWITGERIKLVRNPNYFRVEEGLPYFDVLNFQFTSSGSSENISQLANGQCDVISDTVLDMQFLGSGNENPEDYGFQLIMRESDRLEMLAFGIKPSSYDDYYYPYGVDRPDIFSDLRTRQAFAYCIDRELIANKLLKGAVDVSDSFLPSDHPDGAGIGLTQYPYDPTTATTLLEAAGWRDLDLNPETPRAHIGSALIPYGTSLSVSLFVSEAGLRNEIAAEISANLAACGIETIITQVPASSMYMPGPDGLVFGRKFDLALLSWETGGDFVCEGFMSNEIPSDDNDWLGDRTGGANYYGYSNNLFDSECVNYNASGLDPIARARAGQFMLKALSDELPFIPLFHYLDFLMISSNLCLPEKIDSEPEFFSVIETLGSNAGCE